MDKYIPRDKSEFQHLQQYEREMQSSTLTRAYLFTQAFLSPPRLCWCSLLDFLNLAAAAILYFICTVLP